VSENKKVILNINKILLSMKNFNLPLYENNKYVHFKDCVIAIAKNVI
jgi:hypothetical protein